MPKNQLYWEDVAEGSALPVLSKTATTVMLVKWASVSGDFNPLHYDLPFAESQGIGRPIVHGQLKRAWLIQLLTDWIGDEGWLKKFSCQFRGVDYPLNMKSISEPVEDKITHWCKGKVMAKRIENGEHLAECEIWVEDENGVRTTPGTATVVLPSRGN
ncbi:MAG TPA: MaoC/PaaZ C-terminal domain-containing protein [Syntrophomonas sp.]|nr:MaoC/PaaZ C-terminal domain-containing protein [Syntrophomonas sp.]